MQIKRELWENDAEVELRWRKKKKLKESSLTETFKIFYFSIFTSILKNIGKAGKVRLWLNDKTVFFFCKELRREIMVRSNSRKKNRKASLWDWQKEIKKLGLDKRPWGLL